jgi:hypothetical protein
MDAETRRYLRHEISRRQMKRWHRERAMMTERCECGTCAACRRRTRARDRKRRIRARGEG